MASSSSQFVAEGGKFHLAEALFNAFKYKIRCPCCAGNLTQPGFIKDAAGKVQQKTGEVINSPEQQAKGLAKQVEGKTQKAVGNVEEAVKDSDKR